MGTPTLLSDSLLYNRRAECAWLTTVLSVCAQVFEQVAVALDSESQAELMAEAYTQAQLENTIIEHQNLDEDEEDEGDEERRRRRRRRVCISPYVSCPN